MPKRKKFTDEEILRDVRQFIEERRPEFEARAARFQRYMALAIEAQKRITKLGSLSSQIENSDELLRAIVVLNHAYLEDFLRTLGREVLPDRGEAALSDVPLAKSGGRKEKFHLGSLSQFMGYTVDDVINESVAEYLDKRSFSNSGEIISFLESLGIKLNAKAKKQVLQIGRMIQRRHQIVHRADRVTRSGKLEPQLQTIGARRVVSWSLATSRFMIHLAEMYSRM